MIWTYCGLVMIHSSDELSKKPKPKFFKARVKDDGSRSFGHEFRIDRKSIDDGSKTTQPLKNKVVKDFICNRLF